MMLTSAVIDDSHEAGIGDAADDPIGAFYTSHPYPPPVADLERHRQAWEGPNRRRAEFHLLWPRKQRFATIWTSSSPGAARSRRRSTRSAGRRRA